jgi:phosphoglycolate phosphatase-like HAD superfamily hydrolase
LAVLRAWDKLSADYATMTTTDDTCLPTAIHGDVLFVGDHLDDLRTGRRAGCLTALITNDQHESDGSHAHEFANDDSVQHYADYVVKDGHELAVLLDKLVKGEE